MFARKSSAMLLGAAALGLIGAAPALAAGTATPVMDAATQAQFDAAQKVIPGLSADVFLGAKSEGQLHLYRLSYGWAAAIDPEFQKLFPFLKVTTFEATTNELLQRYAAEARSGRATADVVVNSLSSGFDDLDKEGLVTHYTPTTAAHYSTGSSAGVYYPMSRIQLCNAYNTDLVNPADAKLLETWDGIANPRWQNKAATVRIGVGAGPLLAYYFMDTKMPAGFMKSVAALKPLIFTSVPVLTERLAAGGVDAIFFGNDGNLLQLENQGAPIQWVCPSPGLFVYASQIVGYHAPDLNAAKLWIEFLLSDHGQNLVMNTLGFAPGNTDIKDDRPIAQKPWYKAATDALNFTWSDVLTTKDKVNADWDAVAAGVPKGD